MYQFDSDEYWNNRDTVVPQEPTPAAPVATVPSVVPPTSVSGPFGFVGNSAPLATSMPQPNQSQGSNGGIPAQLQNIPGNASYYRVPVTFDGKTWDVSLSNNSWNQVMKDVQATGKNFNDAVLQASGDGIGTAGVVAGSGYGQYGIDTRTGQPIYGGSDYGGGGMGGGGNGGYNSGLNPFLTQAQQALTSQITDNLRRNILPGLSSAAVASGNFGGSRQGVIEANALNDANRQIANGMANLSFNAFESDANRGLQQQQINNAYDLGLGNLNNSFYTAQRGQDLQSTALGAQLMNMGNANYLGAGSGVANLGTAQQQAPWQVIGNMNNSISPFTGFGSTTSSQNSNPWASALGGAIGGAQIGNLFGGGGMGRIVNSGGVSGLPSAYLTW